MWVAHRGFYEAQIAISGISSARTLLYITAPAAKVVEVVFSHFGNSSVETNEQCYAAWQRIGTLGTPTGTSLTPSPVMRGDQAAGSTVVGNVTASEPTYTANTVIGAMSFPSLNGYLFERPFIIQAADSYGFRLLNGPSAFDAQVTVRFREIG